MSERIEFVKALKKDVKAFVKIIRKKAISCQTYAPNKVSASGKTSVSLQYKSEKPKTSEKKKPQLPVCLFPPHAERELRHLHRDCKSCPEDQNDDLVP